MTHNNKINEEQNAISPLAAAVTGVVVGASVAVAGVVALKDGKNRDKVKKVLTNVKNQVSGHMEEVQEDVEDKKNEIEENLIEGKKELKKIADAAKEARTR